MQRFDSMTRRNTLVLGVSTAVALATGSLAWSAGGGDTAAELPAVLKVIPGSGKKLPVIGLGTNNYSVTAPEEIAARREVLEHMHELGGTVIDTAPGYRDSELVIGQLLDELKNREQYFLATKVTAADGDVKAAEAMIEASFKRLRTNRIELLQVHNMSGADVLMPVLQELKQDKKIRYVGITTSNPQEHARMVGYMRKYPLDFIQVDYSLENRAAASEVLPLAQDRGIAVLVNLPLGGRRGNLLSRVSGRELPAWAAEIDATSWAQVLLKYVVSHPGVTCAIPGITKLSHLQDNQRAGRGRLPDAELRKRMETEWDALGSA